jgi:serine/threonine protein kinase
MQFVDNNEDKNKIEQEIKLKVSGISIEENETENIQTNYSKMAEFVGTAEYMAPETIQGEEITVMTDIWALGK